RAQATVGDGDPGARRRLGSKRSALVRTRHGVTMEHIESEIAEWRAFVGRGAAVDGRDVEELEAHLRDQITDLIGAGLAPDEAFLIAAKRMGRVDDLSQE